MIFYYRQTNILIKSEHGVEDKWMYVLYVADHDYETEDSIK